ncbi:MAG: aminopeptidase P family protein [Spirochaetaceae bacterium]|nr:aminopeptidase P family protein [Spirochaetaceae bacterium]
MNNDIFVSRRKKLAEYMHKNEISLVIVEDFEGRRNSNLRYLCGHPTDAILGIFNDGTSVLVPWDEILAKKMAFSETVVPLNKFGRQSHRAISEIVSMGNFPKKAVIDLPPTTTVPAFEKLKNFLGDYTLQCKEDSSEKYVHGLRHIKSDEELSVMRKAAAITDEIVSSLEKKLTARELSTESDVALFIEKECRKLGCDGTSFDTLVAGPERSFAIHAFPGYTNGAFGSPGLSILDFGVNYGGYASDVTVTVARDLNFQQESRLNLVLQAYDLALAQYLPGQPAKNAASVVDELFAKHNLTMPHGLGHSIGLDVHDGLRVTPTSEVIFEKGMVFSLEPGLYDEKIGGCRYENDVLITEDGNEVLTKTRVVRL